MTAPPTGLRFLPLCVALPLLLVACGDDTVEEVEAVEEVEDSSQAEPAVASPAGHTPHHGGGALDRHALHGGPDAKPPTVSELTSAFKVLALTGQGAVTDYQEVLGELLAQGTEAAGRAVLELAEDPRLRLPDRRAIFEASVERIVAAPSLFALQEKALDVLRDLGAE